MSSHIQERKKIHPGQNPTEGFPGILQKHSFSIEKFIEPLSNQAVLVSGMTLFLLMLLTAINVFLRYVMNRPIVWAYEVSELAMAVLVSLAFAGTATQKMNIHVTVFTDRLQEGARQKLIAVVDFIAFVTCFLLAWRGIHYAFETLQAGGVTSVLRLPKFPFRLILGIGFLLTAIVLLKDFLSSLSQTLAPPNNRMRDRVSLLILALIFFGILSIPFWGSEIVDVNPVLVGSIGLLITLVLLFCRLTIGFGLALIGFLGLVFFKGFEPALGPMARTPFTWVANYTLTVLPLFILMGLFAAQSGLMHDMYDTMNKWVGSLKGGLAMATVAVCALFGAVTGSPTAAAATMCTVALPEMRRHKYNESLAAASIASGGPLASLIPPSMTFIIYGLMTDTSIGKLFIAGIVPGALNTVLFMLAIYLWCSFRPAAGPPAEKSTWGEKFISLKGTGPVILFFAFIIGGIYMGVFTPVEAGGVGALGLFIYLIIKGKASISVTANALGRSAVTTAMIYIMVIGAMILSYFLGATGAPRALVSFVQSLPVPPIGIILAIYLIYIILGCFLEHFAMLMLTLPVFFPIVMALGYDPVWFGVMVVLLIDLAMITPPVGMIVYIMSGLSEVPVFTIFRGVLPFVIGDLFCIGILTAFPQIVTFLPNLM